MLILQSTFCSIGLFFSWSPRNRRGLRRYTYKNILGLYAIWGEIFNRPDALPNPRHLRQSTESFIVDQLTKTNIQCPVRPSSVLTEIDDATCACVCDRVEESAAGSQKGSHRCCSHAEESQKRWLLHPQQTARMSMKCIMILLTVQLCIFYTSFTLRRTNVDVGYVVVCLNRDRMQPQVSLFSSSSSFIFAQIQVNMGGIFTADCDTERVFRCIILAFVRHYEVLLLSFCRSLVLTYLI